MNKEQEIRSSSIGHAIALFASLPDVERRRIYAQYDRDTNKLFDFISVLADKYEDALKAIES